MMTSWAPMHSSVEMPRPVIQSPFDAERGNLFERRGPSNPECLLRRIAVGAGRYARIPVGLAFIAVTEGTEPPLIFTGSRTKSVGRLARSVEIITHRPTMGSFSVQARTKSFNASLRIHDCTPRKTHFETARMRGGCVQAHSIRRARRTAHWHEGGSGAGSHGQPWITPLFMAVYRSFGGLNGVLSGFSLQ